MAMWPTGGCFEAAPRRTATVDRTFLFADLVGFTALTEREGDQAAASAADRLRWATRCALRGDASVVKALGDGVMVVAGSPAAGVATAFALRRLVDEEPGMPPVSIGLHHGPSVGTGDDYFGQAVNLAARLVDEAGPGQILCTDQVMGVVCAAVAAEPLGAAVIKGVADAVVLYELEEPTTTGGM